MIPFPTTPKHSITKVRNSLPLPEFKLGAKSKFRFPPHNHFTESPCKSHTEMMRSQQLLATHLEGELKLQDDLRFAAAVSVPLVEKRLEGIDGSDDEEMESVMDSIISSPSDVESSSPSSSPVLETAYFKDGLGATSMRLPDEAYSSAMFKLQLPAKKPFKPQKNLKPGKTILKRPDGLSFIMNSLNGNYKDATIFATEVNSCLNESIPYPTCTAEKVTIPVNSEIKIKYKQDRAELLGGYYNSTDDDDNDHIDDNGFDMQLNGKEASIASKSDAAVIRAYDFSFEYNDPSNESDRITHRLGVYSQIELLDGKRDSFKGKKVRWCKILEW